MVLTRRGKRQADDATTNDNISSAKQLSCAVKSKKTVVADEEVVINQPSGVQPDVQLEKNNSSDEVQPPKKEQDDWRIKAEERRKAALVIRASKKAKTEQRHDGDNKQPIVTPAVNPYSSSTRMHTN